MPSYSVGFFYERSKWIDVEADSPEAAKDKAEQEDICPSICHACSKEASQNDEPVRVSVMDESGDVVLEENR